VKISAAHPQSYVATDPNQNQNRLRADSSCRISTAGKHARSILHLKENMQAKASVLIGTLRDALDQVEEDSKHYPNDPAVVDLKNSILRGIAELELVIAINNHSQAA
jgi:hypothetical protein